MNEQSAQPQDPRVRFRGANVAGLAANRLGDDGLRFRSCPLWAVPARDRRHWARRREPPGERLVAVDWCGADRAGSRGHLLATFEYFRFVQRSQQNRLYTPRTTCLAVAVAVIPGPVGNCHGSLPGLDWGVIGRLGPSAIPMPRCVRRGIRPRSGGFFLAKSGH